jgi:hypothetical protein
MVDEYGRGGHRRGVAGTQVAGKPNQGFVVHFVLLAGHHGGDVILHRTDGLDVELVH